MKETMKKNRLLTFSLKIGLLGLFVIIGVNQAFAYASQQKGNDTVYSAIVKQTKSNTHIASRTENKAIELSPRHNYELALLNNMLKHFHYKNFKLDNALSEKILNQYIDDLDPGKMYFTQQDIDDFSRYKHQLDNDINAANTDRVLSIFQRYQQRLKERSAYALERILQPIDVTTHKSYRVDRKDASWAHDKKALDTLWDKRVTNDYINLILADKTPQEALKSLKKRYANSIKRGSQIKPNELLQLFANAYTRTIEPHTAYFSPRSSEDFDIQMSLSLSGIGAVLELDDEYTKIISVMPGGPAALSGKLSAGDRIIGVGQTANDIKDIIGWRLTDVVNLIRGKKGSKVYLSILPKKTGLTGKPETIVLVRDKIKLEKQAASKRIIKVGNKKIGVITLPSFYIDFKAKNRGDKNYAGTTRDVKKLLIALEQEGIDGLIIDLRGNGGGSLSEVVSLTDLFIDTGPVVQIQDTNGRKQTLVDHDEGVVYNGPLAVLIDKGSASASEIFAGAIKDYKRGIIIGETSFGKGTVQTMMPLQLYARKRFKKPLGELKITTAQFFRVNGDSTQHKGVKPDISWNLPKMEADFGERSLKNALPWRNIQAAKHKLFPNSLNLQAIKKIEEKSIQRRKHSPKYQARLAQLKLITDVSNEKTLSLNLQQRKSKQEKFDSALLKFENQRRLAAGKPVFQSIKALHDAQEKEAAETNTQKNKDNDAFLEEAAQIMRDIILFNNNMS